MSGFTDLGSHFTNSFNGLTYAGGNDPYTLMKGANPFFKNYLAGTTKAFDNGIPGPTGVID